MSVKFSLLALLAEGDRYGYELRQHFEERTGGAWPVNIGQVYSTLERLTRDGLVRRSQAEDHRQVDYVLTDAGREQLAQWWASPTPHTAPGRDDVALKIALAVGSANVDVAQVLQVQRAEVMQALQDLNRAKRAASDGDEAWELISDALIFRAEAEVRWLDHTEQRLAIKRAGRPANGASGMPAVAETDSKAEVAR